MYTRFSHLVRVNVYVKRSLDPVVQLLCRHQRHPLPQQPMQVKQCKCTKKSIVQVKKKFSVLILIFEIILAFGMTLFKCMIILLIRERKGEKGKLTEFFCTW